MQPNPPSGGGRRERLEAALSRNAALQECVSAQLEVVSRELARASALALSVARAALDPAEKSETFLRDLPGTRPHPFNPWIVAGLTHVHVPGNTRGLAFCELPQTPEEERVEMVRRVFPPLPRHSFSRTAHLVRNPRCAALAAPTSSPSTPRATPHSAETVVPEADVSSLPGEAAPRRKRARPGRRVSVRPPASRRSPALPRSNMGMLRRAYEALPQLQGVTFDTPQYLSVRAVGEPMIQLEEVRDYLGCALLHARGDSGSPRLSELWASSAGELRQTAETQVLQLVVGEQAGVGDRRAHLRRWLSRPNVSVLQSFLLSTFSARGAARCNDPDVCRRNAAVAAFKRIQRRRHRPDAQAEGESVPEDGELLRVGLADKIALCMADHIGLEAHFGSFADPRQAMALAMLGIVATPKYSGVAFVSPSTPHSPKE